MRKFRWIDLALLPFGLCVLFLLLLGKLFGLTYEPSVITRHIVDVAQGYNKFYHDEHILVADEKERTAKLLLTRAAMQTIRNGLALLGIKAPERM